jgi:peptide-methionine (R)-S-oxide reductase
MDAKMKKTDEQWKVELDPQSYYVLREKGTERAFTGEYYHHQEEGTYVCKGCGTSLFSSTAKYNSGSGWPSFYDAVEKGVIETKTDYSHGMIRTEIMCATCGGHLGHVFEDGPNPTGLRYCVNSLSLKFKKNEG